MNHALLASTSHVIGKKYTQRIERHNPNLRTHLKRLARKTVCFSTSEEMHDKIIGWYVTLIITTKYASRLENLKKYGTDCVGRDVHYITIEKAFKSNEVLWNETPNKTIKFIPLIGTTPDLAPEIRAALRLTA